MPWTPRRHGASACNTFTGDLSLTSSATLTLGITSHWTFSIGADGVNNRIYGTGSQAANLNGVFDFDLSGADTTPGSNRTIIDTSSVVATFDPVNFTVAGFTDNGGGLWTDGSYQFDEGTGVLSMTAIPEPSICAMLAGVLALGAVVRRRSRGRAVA
ncbi:MAG: PEP-CTERM sorting domain-containing protein [Opitutaceae bacterium]